MHQTVRMEFGNPNCKGTLPLEPTLLVTNLTAPRIKAILDPPVECPHACNFFQYKFWKGFIIFPLSFLVSATRCYSCAYHSTDGDTQFGSDYNCRSVSSSTRTIQCSGSCATVNYTYSISFFGKYRTLGPELISGSICEVSPFHISVIITIILCICCVKSLFLRF